MSLVSTDHSLLPMNRRMYLSVTAQKRLKILEHKFLEIQTVPSILAIGSCSGCSGPDLRHWLSSCRFGGLFVVSSSDSIHLADQLLDGFRYFSTPVGSAYFSS